MASLSRGIRSQRQKIVKFVKFEPLIFLNCERTCDSTHVSNYDRKTDARPIDTIHDILRCLSLVQSVLKGRKAQAVTNAYETVRNRRVKLKI